MNFVVDANVIFSLLIKEGKTAEIFFSLNFTLYSPKFVLEEIEKHKQEILIKTKRTEGEFEEVLKIIKSVTNLIPFEEYSNFLNEAEEISPDKEDADYFSLALKFNCPIWSNDKKLKEQEIVEVYSTQDLINKFGL